MWRNNISELLFESMTNVEVNAAQCTWAKHVTEQNVDQLLDLYDFGVPNQPLLFKPTLSKIIRCDRVSVRAYFVGGDPNYPDDKGFLNCGWKQVDFQSAVGPLPNPDGLCYRDMGQYFFMDGNGDITCADYTFIYHKRDGRILISLHHSSLTWFPSTDG